MGNSTCECPDPGNLADRNHHHWLTDLDRLKQDIIARLASEGHASIFCRAKISVEAIYELKVQMKMSITSFVIDVIVALNKMRHKLLY